MVNGDILTVVFIDVEHPDVGSWNAGADCATVLQCGAEHGGSVVTHSGPGTMLSFDSARAAIECVQAVQAGLRQLRGGGTALSPVRIGVSAGEVTVAEVVRRLVGRSAGIEVVDLGRQQLSGTAETQRIHGVPWPAAEAHRQIRLLGGVEVWSGGRRIDARANPRTRTLLAALALGRGRPLDRAGLAYRLWPESTDAQARTNLRKVVHELRGWLADDGWLEVDQHQARLCVERVEVDVERFRAALERGDEQEAVDAYRGPLLPGHWEDWVIEERRALEHELTGSLRRLLQEADDPARRMDTAHRLLELDPVDETAHRALILAHAASGNRASALSAFHRCATVLDEQLGVPPGSETVAVYESVRGGPSAVLGAARRPAAFGRSRRRAGGLPPVGRERELTWLAERWFAAQPDGTSAALVTGESGIGKTRLVEELAIDCGRQGAAVLRSRAYESDSGGALLSVIDWLRQEPVAESIARLPGPQRAELGRLLPEHASSDTDRPAGDPAAARARLFDAAVSALAGIGSPVLLVLDDIQWCDADTIDFVLHLLRRGRLRGVMVAMTRRSHERPVDRAIDAKLADLRCEEILEERILGRLQPVATAMIARLASDQPWSDDEVAKLHIETDGLPLFVVEAARSGPGADHLTPTVKGAIERRLAPLPPDHRELLEVAAVIGRRFEPIELATAAGRSEHDVIEAIDDLWQLGLVVAVGFEFDFGHDQFREVVTAGMGPARRRRIHGDVARALASLHGAEPGPVADRLAEHYEQAGLVDDAIEARRIAASRASTLGAHQQAIVHLERAIALLRGRPAGGERDRRELDLVTALGIAHVVGDGYGGVETQRTWARAEALNARLGASLSAPVLRGLGLAAVASCRFEPAVGYGTALCQLDDPIARIEGHYVLGVTRFWQGEFAGAEHHLQRAIDAYDPHNSLEHRARFGQDPEAVCLCRLGYLRALQGRANDADRLMDRAAAQAALLDDFLTAWYVWHWKVALDRYLRRETAGRRPGGEPQGFFSTTDREGPLWARAEAGSREAEAELESIAHSWRAPGRCLELVKWLGVLAQLRIEAADEERAFGYLDEAERFAVERSQLYWMPELSRLRARALRQRGDTACADVARAGVRAAEARGAHGMALRVAAEWLRCTSDRSVAEIVRRELERLRPHHHGWDITGAEAALREMTMA